MHLDDISQMAACKPTLFNISTLVLGFAVSLYLNNYVLKIASIIFIDLFFTLAEY